MQGSGRQTSDNVDNLVREISQTTLDFGEGAGETVLSENRKRIGRTRQKYTATSNGRCGSI